MGSNHGYVVHTNEESKRNRVAAAPAFPGLRRFPQGRRFKQWTGDDSKALMKVRMHIPLKLMSFLLHVQHP
jgi:hypothetical protein